jgi:hypothetical protein
MYKDVVKKAFEKAEIEIVGRTSTNTVANHISKALMEKFLYQISAKTLIKLFKASSNCEEGKDISISSDQAQHLSQYLGYKNYQDYVEQNPGEKEVVKEKSLLTYLKQHKLLLLLLIVVAVVISSYFYINRQRWMKWDVDHYVEVSFDAKGVQNGDLKLYKEDRIENFKKINADCNTVFFTENGSISVWYGKNMNGALEYFTGLGLHPISGKSLKPITEYMIKKYVCETY